MKKIFFIFSFFLSLSAVAVHDTTIVDRTCLIEFNWQSKIVEISKPMCKVLLSGQLVYVYDNSLSDHLIYNKTQTTYVLDYRQVQAPVCPSADSLRKALIRILNAGNCFSGGAAGSGSVTAITPGQGLTTTPNPITTAGSVSVANLGITNAMIANSTINLTTKVTGVLPVGNGGTGYSGWAVGDIPVGYPGGIFSQTAVGSVGQVFKAVYVAGTGVLPLWRTDTIGVKYSSFTTGSVPFQGSGKRLIEDNANFKYDSINKTLNTTRQYMTGRNGLVPLTIVPTESQAIYIESQKGGILVNNRNTDVPGAIFRTDGLGVNIDSKEMALKSTSEKQAAVLNQTGEASADVTASVVAITRDVNTNNVSGTWNCTGAMLDIINNIPNVTSSTGPLVRAQDNSVERFVVQNNGKSYSNFQTDIKLSHAGSVGSATSTVSSVGSTPVDVFTYTVKGKTLDNDGDEFVAKYMLEFSEATKTKTIVVNFAGAAALSVPVFSMPTSSGSGTIVISIIKTGSNLYKVGGTVIVSHGGSSSPIIAWSVTSSTAFSATLTSDQILKLTATCESGSANGGVKGCFGKYYLNPQN